MIEFYLDSEDLASALRATDSGIEQHRYSGSLHERKAQVLVEMKRFPDALKVLEELEGVDPGSMELHFLRADIYTELGKHKLAIEVLCKAEEIGPPDERDDVFVAIAEVYESWERFDKAFDFLKQALELNPKNDDALYRMWFIVNLAENFDDSIRLHRSLIDRHPYSYLAWYNLGQAYFGLSLYEKAAHAFEYVTLINGTYEMAFRDWAEALYRAGDIKKAVSVLEQSTGRHEPDEFVYFKLAKYNHALGNTALARKYYREAIKLDPYYAEAFVRLAELFRADDQVLEAQRALRKATRINPDNVSYQLLLAEISHHIGDLETVISAFRTATRLQPSIEEHWLHLSRHLYDCGLRKEAVNSLEEAIEHCGEKPRLLYARCAYLFGSGRRNEGFVELHQALLANITFVPMLFGLVPALQQDASVTTIIQQYQRQ